MSKNEKSGSDQNDSPEVHAISMDEFGSTIPGVTQLLNPGLERKQNVTTSKGQKTKINLKFGNTSTGIKRPENLESISPKSEGVDAGKKPAPLAVRPKMPEKKEGHEGLSVRFALMFSKSGGAHRFESAHPKNPTPLSPWQSEFFKGMVLDPGILSLDQDFCEFSAKNSKFQGDAFGLEESEWLILMKNDATWYAVISTSPLKEKRDELEQAFFGKSERRENSGEIKIEIA